MPVKGRLMALEVDFGALEQNIVGAKQSRMRME
jgi:hypothetical protein